MLAPAGAAVGDGEIASWGLRGRLGFCDCSSLRKHSLMRRRVGGRAVIHEQVVKAKQTPGAHLDRCGARLGAGA